MADLGRFRERVRAARRCAGRTQQQLAREIGLHPHVLSHKLNGSPGAVLNTREALAIVATLAEWGGITARRDAAELLDLAGVAPGIVASQAWDRPPLSHLDAAPADPPADPSAGAAADPSASALWWIDDTVPRLRPAPLPEPITSLVGREEEVEATLDLLRRSRLVTLLGAGGTGKTRVAVEVAHRSRTSFPDGVAFADLAPLTNPELIPDALLRCLGLAPGSAGAEAQLMRALRPARILLVVDNLEHLVDNAGVLSRVLGAAPGLVLLVTSRAVLRLYGEQQFRIRPLPLPDYSVGTTAASIPASDAVQLFCQRARAVRPEFDPVGTELTAVAEICRVLGGLPLAIELAAAQARTFAASTLLERLAGPSVLQTVGPRDLPNRHQSLNSTLAWSETLLTPDQCRLFAHLGVFAGSFDADAAAAVTGQPTEHVLPQLVQLEDHSLLEPLDRAAVLPSPRFRLLEPVREYALGRLGDMADLDRVRRSHLRHFSRTAQAMGPPRPGADQDPDLHRLLLDQANIRAALDWSVGRAADDAGCLLDALRLVTAAGRMWSRRSLLAEGMAYLQRLLAIEAHTHAAPPELRMAALWQAATFGCLSNDLGRTRHLAGAALALAGELDDAAMASKSHRLLGEAALAAGDVDLAMVQFEEQLELARRDGDAWLIGDALNMLGQGYGRLGRLDEARTTLLASLADVEAAGDLDMVGAVVGSLADIAYRAGDLAEAAGCWVAMLRIHRSIRTYRGIAYGLEGCATVEAGRGNARAAVEFASAAQRIRDAGGWILPEPERRVLTAALAGPISALSEADRRRAIAAGRHRDLDAIIDDAASIARPNAQLRTAVTEPA